MLSRSAFLARGIFSRSAFLAGEMLSGSTFFSGILSKLAFLSGGAGGFFVWVGFSLRGTQI